MFVYAVTIFLSAFLLFQVQPLIAKIILPWFGGSAAVWNAALLFFQLLLLAGYFYAHCLIKYVTPKKQFWTHALLLALSFTLLPIIPAQHWKPTGAGDPTFRIVALLAATVGLPYMLLAATSPLLQAWYVRSRKAAIPYRLFALSNFGSMLALVTYPVYFEPTFALSRQAKIWSIGFVAFALACAFAAWRSRDAEPIEPEVAPVDAPAPSFGRIVKWIALAACASTLLLGTTTHLTQNVAPIPLLWVLPLSLYLLSFIIAFEGNTLYQRWFFLPLVVAALGLFSWGLAQSENNGDIKKTIAALCIALFVSCIFCHGELARDKPHPRYLTLFYLMVSIGGAFGGLFVALVAPRVFNTYLEMPIAVVVCGILVAVVLYGKDSGAPTPAWLRVTLFALAAVLVIVLHNYIPVPLGATYKYETVIALLLGWILVGAALWSTETQLSTPIWLGSTLLAAAVAFGVYLARVEQAGRKPYLLIARNFYGVLSVRDDPPDEINPEIRALIHGTINHGTELLVPGGGRIATSYFGIGTGISRAIVAKQDTGPIRIGILGLGAGVTAALARQQDTLHYYEINPLVVDIAKTQFRFFNECPADKKIFMGDGRLVLESIPSENLDVLLMDAFSSDSVPIHLLTRESYQTYLKHMKPDGVIVINVSNRYLDLEPVIARAMTEMGWSGVVVNDDGADQPYYIASTFIVLSPDKKFFAHHQFDGFRSQMVLPHDEVRPWTDDYSNIIQILKK
jgi:hypothetical protein